MSNTETVVVRGTLHWAKVIGEPRLNNFTGEKEWSVDVTPNAEGRALIKKLGIADRLREPKEGDTRTESYLSFRQRELKANGDRADPIRIVDANGNAWGGDLIGNGSEGDVKFIVKNYGPGRHKGVYIRAIRVLQLVSYVPQDFAPLSSDDAFFAEPTADEAKPEKIKHVETVQNVLDDLDDDVAF